MDYTEIVKAIKDFEAMTSQEIQDQVKPIIKSYDVGFLSEHLGICKTQIYRLCGKLFVEREEKTSFTTYIRIMALGVNPDREREKILRSEKRKAKVKQYQKQYQKQYYLNVTKKKRQEKRGK